MSFITQLGNWLRKISTSITSLSVSGRTITYTRHNGDTGTIQTQDTTYTHPTSEGNKHIPSGGQSMDSLIWDSAGTAKWGYPQKIATEVANTNASRHIFFAYSGDNNRVVYNDKFQYNPSTDLLTVGKINGFTLTDIVTLDKGDHPAAGALSPVIAVKYNNTANSISHTTYPIDYIGNSNTSNAYNTGIRLGSRDGTTILSAGESGSTFASVLQKYDDENLYLVADGSINLYTNCANDCSSYKGPITITNNTITADDFVGKISGHTVAADVPSNAVFTDTHWTSHLYAGTSSGTAHATTTNGNTYLILCDNSTARNRIKITGTGATTVTSDANGVITIHSTDNNTVYTHPTTAGNKHIPAGGSKGQILRWSAAGTAAWGADNNTTYSNMGGASSSAAGKAGLVPAPAKGYQERFLRGDATWQVPTDLIKNFLVSSGTGVGRFMAVSFGTTISAGSWLIFGTRWTNTSEDTNGAPYCIFKTVSTTVNVGSITGGVTFNGWAWRYA